jgi:hypothetical protein
MQTVDKGVGAGITLITKNYWQINKYTADSSLEITKIESMQMKPIMKMLKSCA